MAFPYLQRLLVRLKKLPTAKRRKEELERRHEGALRLTKQKQNIKPQKFQQEQQRPQTEKAHLHQRRPRKLLQQFSKRASMGSS